MLFRQIARVTVQPVAQRQQRRTILNWMTNYPDRVSNDLYIFIQCDQLGVTSYFYPIVLQYLFLSCASSSFFILVHINIFLHTHTRKINELKAKHQAGGRKLYTWQKQPQDIYVFGFGLALTAYGTWQLIVGHYRLATGKGKLD